MKVLRVIRIYIVWCIKAIRWKIKHMTPVQKRLCIVSMLGLLIGGFIGNAMGRSAEQKRSEVKVKEVVASVEEKAEGELYALEKKIYELEEEIKGNTEETPWNLVLVNGSHPMEEGYVPQLTEIEPGYSVDTRVANSVRKMLADAEEEGLHIQICSAYRSIERQKEVFGQSMKERVKDGMDYWKAYEETTLNVAIPGTSEHALGLALDLISNSYTELDEEQEQTPEAKWLAQNCHKYGFILRYPSNKTNITGITYEPWHYRYVGKEHAAEIMEKGITLEEYLLELGQSEEGEQ